MLKIENFAVTLQERRFMIIDKMQVENGKKVLIFGDNEAGRTLLMKSIQGNFKHHTGTIHIKEKPLSYFKKRMSSILIENMPHLLPAESVWKNITLPLEKVTSRHKSRLLELLNMAGLQEFSNTKVSKLSFSNHKIIELIRASIQLPHLILIDDIDNFFDEKRLIQALQICDYATNTGTSLLATSKRKLDHFDQYYRIQDKKMVKL
ncbi:MAG: hypothetical protein B1H06_00985 [Candidatus Cloacimonas sp. 4484_143]|nr:MAG: hypothetical protein B1H06_00985 [Candidatus Cloacimonas sp. 4484_143]RLC49418.1 MAG: hypothetical protein DRI23_09220 [Candidatus Cloacimonadota bacterium]RLC58731.1 MAG: hypothetical protein DRH89_00235 [Candidatus Cloacimonadota bacterium]